MAAREERLPDLSSDETLMFLDLWEGFPCLWNPNDWDYKNSGQKAKALETFTEHFVKGWTPDMIMRKVSSLKACFRKERNRQRGTTGGQGKKGWPFFDRMNGFYGATLYSRSDCPSDLNRASCGDVKEEGTDEMSEKPEAGGDTQRLMNQMDRTRNISSSSSGSSDQLDTLPLLRTPHRGLGNRVETTPTTQEKAAPKDKEDRRANVQKSVTECFQSMQESRKRNQNPEIHFAMDVAHDVNSIQNKRRKQMVKHTIREMVHKALMEEMENGDDDTF